MKLTDLTLGVGLTGANMKKSKKIADDLAILIVIDVYCILFPLIIYVIDTIRGAKLPNFYETMEPFIITFIIFLLLTIVYYPISRQLNGLHESIMRILDKLAEKQNEQKES